MGNVDGIGYDRNKHDSDFLITNKDVAIGFLFSTLGGFIFDRCLLEREIDAWWNAAQYINDNKNFKDILIGLGLKNSVYPNIFNQVSDTLIDYCISKEWVKECKKVFFSSLEDVRDLKPKVAWINLRSDNLEKLENETFEILKSKNLNEQIVIVLEKVNNLYSI